jgi:hypothetical protein
MPDDTNYLENGLTPPAPQRMQQSQQPVQQQQSSNPMNDAATANSQLAGFLSGLSTSSYTPEQRTQLATNSAQLMQKATDHLVGDTSPMRKISHVLGNALQNAGLGIAGASSGHGFEAVHQMMLDSRNRQKSKDDDTAMQLKAAHQAAQMGVDPKMISNIINGYKTTQKGAIDMVNASTRQKHEENANNNAQRRLGIQDRVAGIRQYIADNTKAYQTRTGDINQQKADTGQQHADDWAQHMHNADSYANRMTTLNERIRPYEAKLKAQGLDEREWYQYNRLNQAYEADKARTGMSLLKLHAGLQQAAAHTFIDKNGIAHYTMQSMGPDGKPSGQPYEMQLPTYQAVTAGMSAPQQYGDDASDEDVANQSLSEPMPAQQQQQQQQQPMPQAGAMQQAPQQIAQRPQQSAQQPQQQQPARSQAPQQQQGHPAVQSVAALARQLAASHPGMSVSQAVAAARAQMGVQ